eukprot:COSAG01_NODE_3053_length_6660_cov_12.248133_2_plen_343_part_00
MTEHSPFLRSCTGTYSTNAVDRCRYFGLRTISKESAGAFPNASRLLINGRLTFLTGVLDQGWWPEGQYTAPTDEALRVDLLASMQLGFNFVRKSLKVEPERYYYHADRLGFAIQQDMPQHFLGIEPPNPPRGAPPFTNYSDFDAAIFKNETLAIIRSRRNHPSIFAWTLFNEFDEYRGHGQTLAQVVELFDAVRALDNSRLIDVNSGGLFNQLGRGDFNDFHSYPSPTSSRRFPSLAASRQVLAIGEYCGLSLPVVGHEWYPAGSHGETSVDSGAQLVGKFSDYVSQLKTLKEQQGLSMAVCTQAADQEAETNGWFTYDRLPKLDAVQTAAVHTMNSRLIDV